LKRCCIVASNCADIVGTINGDKEVKFATIEEFVKDEGKRERVDRNAKRRSGNQKWRWVRKDGIESRLGIKKIKGPEIQGARGASGGENCGHTRGEKKRGSSGGRSRTENKVLELRSGEEVEAVRVIVRKDVLAGGGAESGKLIVVEEI
jgi:hypothetical protein